VTANYDLTTMGVPPLVYSLPSAKMCKQRGVHRTTFSNLMKNVVSYGENKKVANMYKTQVNESTLADH